MTSNAGPQTEKFRLSQLLHDTRYRSWTFQILAMFALMYVFAELYSNVSIKLAESNKEPNFGFLFQRAGFDIGQTLIEYPSSSTHLRAAFVGMLNTFLVATLGCALATIIGIFAGVLRLSKNWLISRLMAIYVEGFRNIPLLIWILMIFAVMTEATPKPAAYRAGDASKFLFDSVAITNRGIHIPAPVWGEGSLALAVVFLASLICIWVFRRIAKARQEKTGQILPVFRISVLILFLPVFATYLILGNPVTLSIPELERFNFEGGAIIQSRLVALWFALSLYTGAFIAEIVRAGILSVTKGQTEAAYALGLRPNRTMNLVILPQAMRVIVPPLISQYLNLTKNSSLALAVGYYDVRTTVGITMNQTGRDLEGMLLLGGFYLLASLLISSILNIYNSSIKLKER